MMHPLKIASVGALLGLLLCQLGLFFWQPGAGNIYWIIILSLPLLLPLKGLITSKHYTYKWVGYLALFYFCVGISELVSSPDIKTYALLTTLLSTLLFLASIYYTRYLNVTRKRS